MASDYPSVRAPPIARLAAHTGVAVLLLAGYLFAENPFQWKVATPAYLLCSIGVALFLLSRRLNVPFPPMPAIEWPGDRKRMRVVKSAMLTLMTIAAVLAFAGSIVVIFAPDISPTFIRSSFARGVLAAAALAVVINAVVQEILNHIFWSIVRRQSNATA